MTLMLVRVADAAEATLAAAAGVDAIERVVAGGTVPDLADAHATRAAFPGRFRLSFDGLVLTPDLVAAAVAVGADEIAVPLDVAPSPVPVVDAKRPAGLATIALLAVAPDTLEAIQRVRNRVDAIMFEAGRVARIFDRAGIAQLDAFGKACRSAGLPFGFAGGLEAPDVARLLVIVPDVLGFDTAVRADHRADGPLDPKALDAIRALIPRAELPKPTAAAAAPRSAVPPPSSTEVVDRIFVRDFVVPLAIGAYQAEHGTRQRVRFGVEADVRRAPVPPHDMRDVFSYDVIIETIRVLAQRAHVTFVETLAEEVAAALLTHAGIVGVKVKVEKLDVVEGSVGIEVRRRRPD